MRSTFLQILVVFSSSEGCRLQFSIPSCSYACTYRLFAGTWRPVVSVITALYYVAALICHRRVWYRALSLRYACIRRSVIIFIP